MANKVKIKRSAVASKIPTTTDLELGELAINTFDGKLFTRKDDGTASIIEIGSGGGGITYSLKTANYTAKDKDGILANTTAGSFTVTLPASPAIGASVVINDAADSFGTNNLIVARNGSTIETIADNLTLDLSSVSVSFIYTGTTWQVYSLVVTGVPAGTYATLTGAETLTNKTLTSPTLTGSTSFTGPYHNSYLTQYGSMFIEGTSTNNIVQVSSLGVSTGGGLWSTGVGNTLFSNAGLYFKINTTLRDRDTPTGGTIALSIENNTNAIFAGTVTANSVLLTGNTGTVTSVGGTGTVNGLTLTGTVTNSGNLTLGGTLSNVSLTSQVTDTLPVTSGGTGVTTSTGTGSVVLSTSPSLTTPSLGVASATSIATGLGAVGTPAYTFTGDLNTGMWSPAADTLAFSEGGVEAMRITSAGDIGIGTSAPTAKLTSVANFSNGSSVNFNAVPLATAQGQISGYSFRSTFIGTADNGARRSADITSGFATGAWGTEYLAFGVGNNGAANDTALVTSEKMRITNAGFVGIGTTTPGSRLNVVGHNEFTLGVIAQTSSAEAAILNHPVMALYNNNTGAGNGLSLRYQIADTGGVARTAGGIGMISTAKDATSVTADMYFYTGATEKMRILSGGNVGIGTTAPVVTLDVAGTIRSVRNNAEVRTTTATGYGWRMGTTSSASTLGYMYFQGTTDNFATSFVDGMAISSTGNVGIGTTSPGAKLDVQGAGSVNIRARSTDTTGSTIGYLSAEHSSGSSLQIRAGVGYTYLVSTGASDPLLFGAGGTEKMRILSGGNVGIGTTAPGTKLEVSATSAGATVEVLRLSNPGAGANTQAQLKFTTANTNYGTISGGYGAAAPQMTFNLPAGGNYVWQGTSVEQMRLDASGNLGINVEPVAGYGKSIQLKQSFGATGTFLFQAVDADLQNLELLNNALPPAGGYTGGYNYTHTGSSATKYASTGGNHVWYSASSGTAGGAIAFGERMRITLAGNVGIGTSAPTARFSIVPTSNPTSPTGGLQTSIGEASDNAAYQMRMGYTSSYQGVINVIAGGAGVELLLNPSGGSVGIATNTPTRMGGATSATNLLSVYGSLTLPYAVTGAEPFRMGSFSNTNFVAGSASVGAAIGLTFSNWNAAGIGTGSTIIQAGVDAGGGGITLQARQSGTGVVSNMADFGMTQTTFSTNNTERMRIDSSGNVGIGTTAPGYKLAVVGTLEVTAVKEGVFTITDGAVNLDPNNGSIQLWTLGASRTPGQANWATGQSITLMIDDGAAYAVTWSTLAVVWKTGGGTAPTLNTTGFTIITLWKVGTTIYGARVGDA